jgi:heptosyltransferase-3
MTDRWAGRGRNLLEAPLHLVPRGPRPPVPAPDTAIRRVLVVRPDERIGNLVLLTPMIDAINRAWPGVTVDLLAGGAMEGLFRGDPRIASVVVFDKRALVRNPLGLAGIARRIRGRYDLAIDASHSHHFSLTSALLTRATGARWRLGYFRGPGERLLNAGIEYDGSTRRYTADHYVDLLRVLAPSAATGPLRLPVLPAEREAAREILLRAGALPGETLVGIHPGGRGSKRWAADRFVALSRRLSETPGRRILLFHGPGEEHLVAEFPNGLVTALPRLPLRGLAAAIAECRLFISSDTGPMHLAAAVGVPTLALFIHGNAAMFAPRGDGHRVLEDPAGPAVERVHEAAEAMLRARNPLTPGSPSEGFATG